MEKKKFTREEQEKLNQQLFEAISNNDLSAVKTTVEAGADINAKNKYGESVLHISMSKGTEITQHLLEAGADPNIQDNNGNTALHETLYWNRLDAVRLLLKHKADMYIKNNKGETAYTTSVIRGHRNIARLLVSHGYVPSKEDLQLMVNIKLFASVGNNDLIAIEEAVKAGADVNAKDIYGESILYKSIPRKIKTMECLLKAGSNPDVQKNNGKTILHTLVKHNKYPNKIRLFLKYNANMYIKDNDGETPFDLSLICGYYNIAELFISAGYIPSDEDMQKVKNYRLLNAIENNDLPAVKAAVEEGALINEKNAEGVPFLYKAVYEDLEIIEYLLKSGADPKIQDKYEETSLYLAAREGDINKVQLLLKYNANVNITNHEGKRIPFYNSPFYAAILQSHYDIAELLVLSGYIPSERDFNSIENNTERKHITEYFINLAAQAQEHKRKLTEEAKSQEFSYADEIMEI